jgi:hypothetical protein
VKIRAGTAAYAEIERAIAEGMGLTDEEELSKEERLMVMYGATQNSIKARRMRNNEPKSKDKRRGRKEALRVKQLNREENL